MGISLPSRLRVPSIAAAAALVLGSVLVATPALADSNPTDPTNPSTPTTVTADALATPQINGVVWSQKIVGNTVYAGGDFSTAQPAGAAAGVSTVTRTDLLAYDITTGALNTTFAPTINGVVKAVAASPDGSIIYIGGTFTTVNGVSRSRLAALNATTGALITTFNPAPNYTVAAIVPTATTVYFGGSFASVGKSTRGKLAAATASTGAVTAWAPVADGGQVTSMAMSPDGTKIIVGGGFTTVNGSSNPGYGLAALDTSGNLLPWNVNNLIRNGGSQASITSLTASASGLYGSGYVFGAGGNLEGSFRADWATGNLIWVEDCHGDTYSTAVTDTAEYIAGHPHYCGNIGGFPQTSPTWTFHRGLAFSIAATGTATADPYGYYNYAGNPTPSLLTWFPDFNTGTYTGQSQGPWSVAATNDYVVYGGEFTTVNGVRQQGLVRFAVKAKSTNKRGPQLSGANFTPKVVSLSSGTARVSFAANYDQDSGTLKYEVYRNNNQTTPVYKVTADSTFWKQTSLGFVDTGLTPGTTYSYRVRATDPDGNTVIGDTVSVVASSATPSSYAQTVAAQGASSLYRLDEASGTTVYDNVGYTDAVASSGVTRGAAGATTIDGDTASTFDGTSNGLVSTQSAVPGPQTFSVEAWVKTTTTTGGKIVGFGNASTGNSSSYDRHLYIDPNGNVNFGVYNGNTQTLTSATPVNDGQWHQVIGTLSSGGMQLFVDGKRVGSRTDVTSAQDYSGFWRIGGDSSWWGDAYLKGSIDDVSIYPTALTPTQVNNQYVAAGYPSQLNSAPTDTYGARVFSDSPVLYYRLDDTTGSAAKDSSLAGSNGSYTGGVTKSVAGALAGNSDTAASFDGSTGQVNSAQSFYDPEVYSEEAWFKTTTTTGGKIVGFGSSQTGSSGSYDRHIYMQDNGQLVFGTYTGQTNTITTAGSYNDGAWHQVVATQSSAGLKLYVDGALQGTNPTTQAQAYTGYWKIGGDTTWGSSSNYFNGSIDEVAIYDTALSASTVSAHYSLGTQGAVNVAPTASFTSSATNLTASFDASASADSDGTIASYAWDFGDGTTGTGKTPSHTYATAGTKTVTLTVTDNQGATGTATAQVVVTAPHVNVPPTASFTSAVTDLTAAFDASASSDSDGTVASYAWDFGDSGTSTQVKPSHTYTTAGTYAVKLTVTDNDGATASSTAQVTVTAPRVNQAPTAAFTATTSNLGVTVNGSASTDSDGTVASYAWTFGDGSVAVGPTASHSYAAAGTYTVKLTVTDNEGATGTLSKTVTVAPPANVPPTASFTSSSNALVLSADASASTDPDGTIASYAWTFGDGGTATGKTPTHTYASAGTYAVTLTVTDNQGATGTSTSSVVVSKAPNVAPTASFSQSTANLKLTVDGTTSSDSDGTIASYAWTFGDGGTATTATATHTYATAGTYAVKLTVTDNDGASTSTTQQVTVTAPANVAPTASFTTSMSGLTLSADGSGSTDSDGTIASYAWTFGDGGTSTAAKPSYTYATGGTYTVTLKVTDNQGATNTATATVTATAPAAVPFYLDTFNRTVAGGFGTADTGGAWTATGSASALSVSPGAGAITLSKAGAQAGAQLMTTKKTDTDLRAQFQLDKAATGGGTYIYVSGRRVDSNNEYRATLKLTATNTATLTLTAISGGVGTNLGNAVTVPGTFAAGANVSFRMQVTGTSPTTVKLKAWLTGTPEPTAWQLTQTDSSAGIQAAGGIAVQGYVSGSATNAPQTLSVSQLSGFAP